jgi:hypothetical protein
VSGIAGYLEGFAKNDEALRRTAESKSQAIEFAHQKFVASDPQSQVMSPCANANYS